MLVDRTRFQPRIFVQFVKKPVCKPCVKIDTSSYQRTSKSRTRRTSASPRTTLSFTARTRAQTATRDLLETYTTERRTSGRRRLSSFNYHYIEKSNLFAIPTASRAYSHTRYLCTRTSRTLEARRTGREIMRFAVLANPIPISEIVRIGPGRAATRRRVPTRRGRPTPETRRPARKVMRTAPITYPITRSEAPSTRPALFRASLSAAL
mmetsp:Transcript_788/g.2983  ORF Transcript_788/g.2983 Transcript_788/m.2983 type:complete len:208 (+) Transcript_788:1072-1695(+)